MATIVTKEPLKSQGGVVEDENLKKNTDCVYFLASPLTCKKGSECEYRHSEYARVNPRDCWYWLNGNCLNPKCSFRHPPLDGLVGPQTAGPPTVVPPSAPVPVASQNPTKQGVPCIFFQQGYCLKGDRCPFMHGPNPVSTKTQQFPASTTASKAPAFKKAFGSLEKGTQPKGNVQVNAPKVVEAPAQVKVVPKIQVAQPANGQPAGRVYRPPSGVIEEAPKYEEMKPSVANGNLRSRTERAHHDGSSDDLRFHNGRDVDDLLRESSPGFDVLVDDKLSDDEYYHNEDQYARMGGHEGRDLNEVDMNLQDDYNSVADVDPEMYHNRRGYDSFDRVPEKYAWDHRKASSEKSLVEPAHYDRRGSYKKSQSPDYNRKSDLRQRLSSKQRRVNGMKSVVNPDYNLDAHAEDQGYRSTRRDSRRSPVHDTSRGQRLQGRIKLPMSSQVSGNDMYSERENERGRNWGRLSPNRNQVSGQQGRLRDRLSGRNLEESSEGRRISGPVMRRDTFPANGSEFAGPKRLSELKDIKQIDSRQHQVRSQQSVAGGKQRDRISASSFGTDDDLSFEGPKPLSEILKRKRTGSISETNSSNKEEIKQQENDLKFTSTLSNSAKDTGKQVTLSSTVEQAMTSEVVNMPVAPEADEEEGEISNKKIKLGREGESSLPNDDYDNKHPEVCEDKVAADGEEQAFDEEYDQGDGEYEYEQNDGEGYNLNEIETGELEGDSMDDDDGDDFAKTLGVSF